MVKFVANHQMASIAVLGGTFDPVHIGHLRIAIQLKAFGFEQVLLMPNSVPPHRPQPQASAKQRFKMLELATSELEGIGISGLELASDQPSYTANSLKQLREQYPTSALTWVMGTDAWNSMHQWYEPSSILELANLLVVTRPGEVLKAGTQDTLTDKTNKQEKTSWQQQQVAKYQCSTKELLQRQNSSIAFAEWPELDISASDLRKAIKQGDNITFLTPKSVQDYIQQNQLYQ